MDDRKRQQNERKFGTWRELVGGGRLYSYKVDSSVESVGEFWLGKLSKNMVQGEFSHSESSKAVGFSHGNFGLVVETLDNPTGDHLLGLEIIGSLGESVGEM